MESQKVVVYSAVFGNYDQLRPISLPDGWIAVCYTNVPGLEAKGWIIEQMDNPFIETDVRKARSVKIYGPRKYMNQGTRYIWIDANLEYQGKWEDLNRAGFWAMKHPERKCAYDEGKTCILLAKDDINIISRHLMRLLNEYFPHDYGLHATGVLVRTFDEITHAFSIMWAKEVRGGSHRDQISFDYCRWKTGITINSFPFLQNIRKYRHAK